jgi:phage protein D
MTVVPEEVAVPIFKGQDFYVPYFQVKLDGRPQGLDVVGDILSVSYKDNIQEIDSFELTINNWDAKTRDFKYSDSDLFDPGKELELLLGYYGGDDLRLMVKGQITSLRPAFPAGGGSTLVVAGLNVLHKLRTQQESHAYEKKTDTEVAKAIADRLGVDLDGDPSPDEKKYDYLLQDNQYDIIFLLERARRVGYDLTVKEKGKDGKSSKPLILFGRSSNIRRAVYELAYGRSLIEFKPDLTTANQVGEVTVRGWDQLNKKKIEATAKRSEIAVKGVGKAGGQASIEQSFNQRREIVATKPVATEAEAKTLAIRTLEENAKDMVKATGATVGLPDLRAGSVLMISGAGTRFSGRYFVTATTHTIGDGGYTTQFECRREELK